jgi:hypothetical protein
MKRETNDEGYGADCHDAGQPKAEKPADFFQHTLGSLPFFVRPRTVSGTQWPREAFVSRQLCMDSLHLTPSFLRRI